MFKITAGLSWTAAAKIQINHMIKGCNAMIDGSVDKSDSWSWDTNTRDLWRPRVSALDRHKSHLYSELYQPEGSVTFKQEVKSAFKNEERVSAASPANPCCPDSELQKAQSLSYSRGSNLTSLLGWRRGESSSIHINSIQSFSRNFKLM